MKSKARPGNHPGQGRWLWRRGLYFIGVPPGGPSPGRSRDAKGVAASRRVELYDLNSAMLQLNGENEKNTK